MPLLSSTIFQPPLTTLFLTFQLSLPLLIAVRTTLFLFVISISIPLILLLVPLSLTLLSSHHDTIRNFAPLPLHPHNLPPHKSWSVAYLRGIDVYIVGAIVWAATVCGPAPDLSDGSTRWIGMTQGWFAEKFSQIEGNRDGEAVIGEILIPSVPRERCIGVLDMEELDRKDNIGFTLRHVVQDHHPPAYPSIASPSYGGKRKRAILFFAGGGYVTGSPLIQSFLFNLIRSLPPISSSSKSTITPQSPQNQIQTEYVLLSPNIRKSLSPDRAFPIPLLDALSAYSYLVDNGYTAEEIVVMGDSAGAGLVWSLLVYLAILDRVKPGCGLGIPKNVIMISPWLSLVPPTSHPTYPDFIYPTLLTQAARCYLSRFPLPGDRSPFISGYQHLLHDIRKRADALEQDLRGILALRSRRDTSREADHRNGSMKGRKGIEDTIEGWKMMKSTKHITDEDELKALISPRAFQHLSSAHPLFSPAYQPLSSSTATSGTIHLLAQIRGKTKLHIHVGTAEHFYDPTMVFVNLARATGVEVEVVEESGGYHIEGCIFPAELGGVAGRLRGVLKGWIEGF